ncbi:hypothetical protein, partial [Candidatus Hakubella thermalkaliphila]|uniref:hypothetical protein n=1 Tax=Candidatus Hakubella thermalkaliphila TaxID=2754717 RepID=UPI001C6133CA
NKDHKNMEHNEYRKGKRRRCRMMTGRLLGGGMVKENQEICDGNRKCIRQGLKTVSGGCRSRLVGGAGRAVGRSQNI